MAKKGPTATPKRNGKKRGPGNPQNLLPPWKPGQSGNPKGRPKVSDIERAAREASKIEIAQTWPRIKAMTIEQLKAHRGNAKTPGIEAAMCSAVLQAVLHGELNEIHRYYDRLLGRPRQDMAVSGDGVTPVFNVINLGGQG